jgi:hypothetical protein
MVGRAQVGIGVAGLALTAAVLTSFSLLTVFFIAVSVLALVASAANRLPWLHTWPLVGAPKVAVALKLDGSADLRVGIRRYPQLPLPLPSMPIPLEERQEWAGRWVPTPSSFEARTAHLEIGINNMGRTAIPAATVTFMHPEGLPHAETDPSGRDLAHGNWMPPTDGALGDSAWADYWTWRGDLPATSLLVYFKLKFAIPGTYLVRVKVNAGDLYQEIVAEGELVVSEVPRDALPPVDAMAYAIQEVEGLRDVVDHGTTDVGDVIYTGLLDAVPDERDDLRAVIENSDVSTQAFWSGHRYTVTLANAKLRAAYDVRRRLGS